MPTSWGLLKKVNKKNIDIIVRETAYGEVESSLNHWEYHRNKLNDLYPSERYYLEPALKNVNSVLDVGCAAGGSFSFCLEANPVLNYTGIDVSKSLIELARSIYPEATFLNYDGHALPFSDNHFDLVFSLGVLHHLHHWQSLIKQMVKCSKKYTVFDLRLTNRNTLNNPTKYYQKVSFDNHWDNKTAISYIVVNFHEFIKFIKENFGNDGSRIESYGYFAKPTELANIPYDQIFMCSLKFEKNSKSPGVFIDIPD